MKKNASAFQVSGRMNVKRRALMLSCATLAIATVAIAPQKAQAQAFSGTIASGTGATQTSVGAGTSTITVTSSTATLNWTPDNSGTGNINFLPDGNVATFTSSLSDFTVLNRVVPVDATRAIELNGTVVSNINSGASVGGNVWFYSPGGIVVGSSAVFDVGGLLLSTLDVTGWSADSNGFNATFAKTEATAGTISINSDAQINALQQNSYVALIAPRIEQAGTVMVDGSAAYVAAEQLTMTMNQGLFDIAVDIDGGTGDAEGIVHSGTTTGPASSGEGDNHRIYMVAVPKNQALTMALNGNVGFAEATSASVVNGEIVLSAGWNVYEASGEGRSFEHASDGSASMHIRGAYSSDVEAIASTDIFAWSDEWGTLSFDGDVSLYGYDRTHMGAGADQTLTVGGDVIIESNGLFGEGGEAWLYAGGGGTVAIAGDASVTSGGGWAFVNAESGSILSIGGDADVDSSSDSGAGGTATIAAGGTLTIDGNASVTADGTDQGGIAEIYVGIDGSIDIVGALEMRANGIASLFSEVATDAFGGSIYVDANSGGTISAGSLEATANGFGSHVVDGGTGGDGYGGTIEIGANQSGSVSFGNVVADANGYGGTAGDGSIAAGSGYGGFINVAVGSGSISFTGDADLSATGYGGSYVGEGLPSSAAGVGEGGSVWVQVWGPGSLSIDGLSTLNADGLGGYAQTGGDGYGGNAGFTAFDGSMALGDVDISVAGDGGDAIGIGGDGGNGVGGTGYVEARGVEGDIEVPATTATITGGNVTINARGSGGAGGDSDGETAAGDGGTGYGGLYTGALGTGGAFAASMNGSTLQLGDVSLSAEGFGGAGGAGSGLVAGGNGGDAFGGTVEAGNYGPVGAESSSTYGHISLHAGAQGGDGGSGAIQGNGGDATAGGFVTEGESTVEWGGAYVTALGDVTIASAQLFATATGGAGAVGGDAQGGVAQVAAFNDTNSVLTVTGALQLYSSAVGGSGDVGGNATGGYAGLGVIGGETGATINVGANTRLEAYGTGGAGVSEAGSGTGGMVQILVDNGTLNVGTINALAYGNGGSGVTGGGTGYGGEILFEVGPAGVINSYGTLNMRASGFGGESTSGDAGAGYGGTFTGVIEGDLAAYDFIAFADGVGGNNVSGEGGYGEGGITNLTIDGGNVAVTHGFYVTADGVGGNGSSGGAAQGGEVSIDMTANGGSIIGNITEIHALAWGGEGIGGGAGGAATGGETYFDVAAMLNTEATAEISFADMYINSDAEGGDVTGAGGGTGGAATGGTVMVNLGASSLDVSGTATISAYAIGGAGGSGATGGAGGAANGGSAYVDTQSATVTAATLIVAADATGGDGGAGTDGNGGAGGDAAGGDMAFLNVGGNVHAATVTVSASASGGAGGSGDVSGIGGNAIGGHASLDIFDGAVLASTTTVDILSLAQGGDGSSGGDAVGGITGFGIYGSGVAAFYDANVESIATAGNGTTGSGGIAEGGSIFVNVQGALGVDSILGVDSTAYGGSGATGGNAFGGNVNLAIDGGAMSAGDFEVYADGEGGAGVAGGTGTGGDIAFSYTENGGSASFGSAWLEATGTGGSGTTGAGGVGTGGDVSIAVTSGASLESDFFLAMSLGEGGSSVSGAGGDGVGASILTTVAGSGSIEADEFYLFADAGGGSSSTGAGGDAQGGDVQLTIDGGSFAATEIGMVTADAVGGEGATGGHGIGGTATLTLTSNGGSVTGGAIYVNALGLGGGGTNGGGDGLGGVSTIETAATLNTSATATISVETLASRAFGRGGLSSAGLGGDGSGGDASIVLNTGAITTSNLLFVDAAGNGGSGTTGGFGDGGIASLIVSGATVINNGSGVDILADGTGGSGNGMGVGGLAYVTAVDGSLDASAIDMSANGTTSGGTVHLQSLSSEGSGSLVTGILNASANGGLYAGDVLVDVESGATADIGVAQLSAVGSVAAGDEDGIEIDVAGQLDATSLTLTSSDDILIATYSGGQILVDDRIDTQTPGLIRILDDGNGGLVQADVVDLDGGQLALTGNLYASDIFLTLDGNYDLADIIYASDSLVITVGGAVTASESVYYGSSLTIDAASVSVADMTVDGSLSLNAAGAIQAGNLQADGSLTLDSGGNITALTLAAGGGIAVEAGGTLVLGDIVSGFIPPITVDGFQAAAAVATVEDVNLSSAGNMTTGDISSGGGITLNAGGTLTTADLDAAGAIGATSVGNMLIGSAEGASVALTGQANVTSGDIVSSSTVAATAAGNLTLSGVDAAQSVTLASGGTASLLGLVSAPVISVASANLNIGESGQLGEAGVTELLNLVANSNSAVVIGGSAAEGQYHLSQAEAERIEAAAVNFTAQGVEGAAPDIIIHDFTIGGSQTDGGGVGQVVVTTAGNVIVDGHLLYADASDTDSLAINAGETIQVITDSGSITMAASDDSLSGELLLTADHIWVGSEALIDQLAADPNFSGRDTALATNDGEANPEGSIRAGAIDATVSDTFLVQNSGTAEDFAGITVGEGGLTVENAGDSPATTVIYGQQVSSDGSVISGDEFAEAVDFTGNTGSGSSVNGCNVSGTCGEPTEEPYAPGAESILGPIGLMGSPADVGSPDEGSGGESEGEEEEDEGSEDEGSVDPSVHLINSGPLQIETTVEQPVTSGSDAMLPGGSN